MKICHIFKIIGVSGSENHLLTLASRLDHSRYRLTFCLLVERGPDLSAYIAALEDVGVEVVRFPIRADLDPLLLWRLVRFLRAAQPDIVHTHLIHGDLYGTLAARLAGVPVVISTKHNDDAFRRRGFYAWLDRALARSQSRIITISHHLKRFYTEVEGLPADKLVIIHYGLDAGTFLRGTGEGTEMRAELGVPNDAPLVGVVGRLTEQKGHTYLLDAFAVVVQELPTARLLVVGDGELRPALARQVVRLGLQDSVTFAGRREDVPRIMTALDVLVMPSLWEGFGLVLLEAMAAGKPIVASRVSAIPEIVVDGETGLLVPPRDVKALAAALIELLRNPQRAVEIGRRGRARLEQEFTVERMVAQTEALYEGVCKGQPGAAYFRH
ncbi:MAG: glycosyltransferase [Anaerolineae bacterium]|nr:glycosyltransferase [Anaerolineae bacterium]